MKPLDTCEWCGAEDREVDHSHQHDAWLCIDCFLSSPGGAYIEEPARQPTLRELHPSRVFEPVSRRRSRSNRDELRARMRCLDEADRREVEAWIKGDEDYPLSTVTGLGLAVGGVMDIPSDVYVPALVGREMRGSRVPCPFHGDGEQQSPSLQAYDDGWYCHGCQLGGSIIDLAAELWGMEPRGRGFHEIRERLEDHFGLRAA